MTSVELVIGTMLVRPDGFADARASGVDIPTGYELRVEYRGRTFDGDDVERYAISDGFRRCMGRRGQWQYESGPSSRTDRFKRAYRFPYDEALTLAMKHVNRHRAFNRLTFAEFLDWHTERVKQSSS